MTRVRSIFGQVRSAISLFFSAGRVAGAVERRNAPEPRDLRRMGIDPRLFLTIGMG